MPWPRWPRRADAASPDITALRALSKRSLFIIGHARSGTTVLLSALNSSPDVYLLGEPDFHTDPGTPDFRARHRAMHAALGNQSVKSTALPPLLAGDAPWWTWLDALATYHRWVGAKIALNPGGIDPDHLILEAFQARQFYNATYIFCFRAPLQIALSRRELSVFNDQQIASWESVLFSIVSVIRLYIRMVRLFPNVHAVVHENAGSDLPRLAVALDCDLTAAASYYDTRHVRYHEGSPPAELIERYASVGRVHDILCSIIADGVPHAQREQNDTNISPGHLTRLGQLSRVLGETEGPFRASPTTG